MAYKIEYKASVVKDLKRIDKKEAARLLQRLEQELGRGGKEAEPLRGQFRGLWRLRIGAQRSVFRSIPGLAGAEFLRWGSIHRNAYLNFPLALDPHGGVPGAPDLVFAGQLTGVEGYTESASSGILAGINVDRILSGLSPVIPPPTTMMGGLYRYLRECASDRFQPMNSNWGLVDPLNRRVKDKVKKREMLAERAETDFRDWMEASGIAGPVGGPAGGPAGGLVGRT